MINEHEYTVVRLPSKMYDTIEKKVFSLYKELNITKAPIDPFDIAKRKGYIIKPFSHLDRSTYINFIQNNIDGISHYDPDAKTFVIYYDDTQGLQRVRFTIMHEIGHIEMGHKQESELARKIADYYAAYALAPSPLIDHYECEDYMDIVNKFDISQPCADICFQRYTNWLKYDGNLKKYEISLLDLFQ